MSWQSFLFNLFLRLRRRILCHHDQFNALREQVAKLDSRRGRKLGAVPGMRREQWGEYDCDHYCPDRVAALPIAKRKVVIYYHGGAYCLRAPHLYGMTLRTFCDGLQSEGFMADYRLAPEHPHPAGEADCLDAYRRVLALGYSPANIVMMGDSAGGGLSLTTLQALKQSNLPLPCGLVLISPAGDWHLTGASYYLNQGKDPMFHIASFLFFRKLYCGDDNDLIAGMSPLSGDFSNFPPSYITTSDTELMRDTAVEIHDKIRASGGRSTLSMARGLCHVYPLLGFMPEAKKARQQIIEFARQCLAAGAAE